MCAAALLVLAFLLTDGAPAIDQPAAPTPEQVSAARAAAAQLKYSRLPGNLAAPVSFTSEQLDAIGILSSDALRPNRFSARIDGQALRLVASRPLKFGRWLNVTVVSEGGTGGFPRFTLTAGSLTVPSILSRIMVHAGRFAVNLFGANVPPPDVLIQSAAIRSGGAMAMVHLPPKSHLLDRLSGPAVDQDGQAALDGYCKLIDLQSRSPTRAFPEAVKRAFALVPPGEATVASNRAAFVALAMLTVDRRVGELVGLSEDDLKRCGGAVPVLDLNGRFDLSKHWALSAALAVTTGVEISRAMGEWKELSDSVSAQSQFARGDPSGFSFLDLTADRSGLLVAKAAIDPETAQTVAGWLSQGSDASLFPRALMSLPDSLSEQDFRKAYGSIADPRFAALKAHIDGELKKQWRW